MLIFSFEDEPVCAWDPEANTLHIMAAAGVLDPDDPTWVKIQTANNPAALVGCSTYAPAGFRSLPIRVDGLDYPSTAQAVADGKGSATGLQFTTSHVVDTTGPWSLVWAWDAAWTTAEGVYQPPVDPVVDPG